MTQNCDCLLYVQETVQGEANMDEKHPMEPRSQSSLDKHQIQALATALQALATNSDQDQLAAPLKDVDLGAIQFEAAPGHEHSSPE